MTIELTEDLANAICDRIAIYALCDETGRIRYIGKANNAAKRFAQHMRETRRKSPLYDWIGSMLRRGKTPTLHVVEYVSALTWRDREQWWIREIRKHLPLLNVADGGDEPFCPTEVRAANARKVTAARHKNIMRFYRAMEYRIRHADRWGVVPGAKAELQASYSLFKNGVSLLRKAGKLDLLDAQMAKVFEGKPLSETWR